MRETDFTYAVARVRYRETKLLTDTDLTAVFESKDVESALRLLKDKGWGEGMVSDDIDAFLKSEEERTWDFVHEIVEDDAFDFFLVPNDFHNLKVAIKAITRDESAEGIMINESLFDADELFDAVEKREYDRLPEYLQAPAQEAMQVLLQTSDGQLCDIIIDKACLETVYQMGMQNSDETIKLYAELYVASADIKIAVRACKTGKSLEFIRRALADCATLDTERLAVSASLSYDDLIAYLSDSEYAAAVPMIQKSLSAFEKWCDDYLIEKLQPMKWEPFTIGPVFAYIIARKNEIKAVRMILSGKVNGLSEQTIRERLRMMYV